MALLDFGGNFAECKIKGYDKIMWIIYRSLDGNMLSVNLFINLPFPKGPKNK